MTRLLFPLLTAALLAGLCGCASREEERSHPGVRLRRSDSLYAGETYGDPARRRERKGSGPLQGLSSAVRKATAIEEPGGF